MTHSLLGTVKARPDALVALAGLCLVQISWTIRTKLTGAVGPLLPPRTSLYDFVKSATGAGSSIMA